MLAIDHKAIDLKEAQVVQDVPNESTRVSIERSYKKDAYLTEAVQAVLRPYFGNGKIGQPIPVSDKIAEELLRVSEDYNRLESIAWNATYAVFKYYEQGEPIAENIKASHEKQIGAALNDGPTIAKNYSKISKYLMERVESNEGKPAESILAFANDNVASRHKELNYLIEPEWEFSKLKRRLIDAKRALERIPCEDALKTQKRS